MKKLLIFSILALSISATSCTADDSGTDTQIHAPQANDSGGNGQTTVKPPPPCATCP